MKEIQKTTGFFKSFDETPIYYEVRGDGPPLVLVYGLVCSVNHWRHQIKYFSGKYKTIVFDLRGHHNTPIPQNPENLSVDALARDIKCLLDHLKIEKASLWGHSFGAPILLRFLDMFEENVHDLVLINAFARNPIKNMFGLNLVEPAYDLFKKGYNSFPETLSHAWKVLVNNPLAIQASTLFGGFNSKLTHFKDIEIYARGVANVDASVFISMFGSMKNYDAYPVLDRINCPTLIIGGSQDSVTPLKYQKELYKNIRGSELLIVPYGSHCTQLDMPDLVNLRIEKFLQAINY